ncbi:sialate O-acetylesterase [bacterium]|jgi:hypothetical protein|nr:hypothetical protein [Planctomicrobium sp.]MDB4731708.1 sialate O-acetylesterase [bacterium]
MRPKTILSLAVLFLLGSSLTVRSAEPKKPLKVFILSGQSNMQGHARVSTFSAMRLNPKTASLLKEMQEADGTPKVSDQVWISAIGSSAEEKTGRLTVGYGPEGRGAKIGPEFTFGLTMEKHLDEPILIIKTAWGGKSINTDFRPPNAGPYVFSDEQLKRFKDQKKDVEQIKKDKIAATGVYYELMIEHVQAVLKDIKRVYPEYDPQQGYELAGFVWFQGWNDMVDSGTYPQRDQKGGYDQYSHVMAHFIRDVRKSLATPDLPFVIGIMGVGGPTAFYGPDQKRYLATHQNFRDAMAAPATMPEFENNVVAVLTENYWDMEATELRKRERSLKPQFNEISESIKSGKTTREVGDAKTQQLYADNFNMRELEILKESVSNAEYHYLGSAGILGQIGKAFADALVELDK